MTAQMKNKEESSSGFGSRKIKLKTGKTGLTKGKQATLFSKSIVGKENADEARSAGPTPLKGFQLWLAENKETVLSSGEAADEAEVAAKGLEVWKGLSKEEKETYKTPRAPKRKRVDDDDDHGGGGRRVKLSSFMADE